MNGVRVVVLAKAPQAGLAKTRLIPALGSAGAARLAALMLDWTLEQALATGCAEVEAWVMPAPADDAWAGWQPPTGVRLVAQPAGDLGARLAQAARRAFRDGFKPLLVGTDCPQLDAARLDRAAAALADNDIVIHGTHDGGYALLGLGRETPELFRDIDWSSARVFRQTLSRARRCGRQVRVLRRLHDIDEPADLQHLPAAWSRHLRPTDPAGLCVPAETSPPPWPATGTGPTAQTQPEDPATTAPKAHASRPTGRPHSRTRR